MVRTTLPAAVLLFLSSGTGYAADAATPGELRSYSTIHSIGIEWDITGDANHNAVCTVQYREKGSERWKAALPLFRIDFFGWYAKTKADRAYNMFAGSILFLQPGTSYEVILELSDPDGGRELKLLTVPTRPLPALPVGGRTLHVVPGNGGGDGSKDQPFRGLAAAQQAAQPGDIFLLGGGSYGHFACNRAGKPGQYIVWKSAGDAVLSSVEISASHVWLEGLTFKKADRGTALKAQGVVVDCVVSRCTFGGFRNSIVLSKEAKDWYIADNTIVGINQPGKSDPEGEGIDLYQSEGHVVCYNWVSRVQAGVHYPKKNCDIFGNDIFDTTDDGVEPDYGYANIRMWENRITNFGNNALSFQPQYCGPWYFIRNQVIGAGYIFKFRVQDRFLLANNTFVTWSIPNDRMQLILTALARNNLYISATTKRAGPFWITLRYKDDDLSYVRHQGLQPNWMTDVDHDGFDWGDAAVAFSWNGSHVDLKSFSAAVGIEKNAVRVRKHEIFENYRLPEKPARVEPVTLTLKAGCNAIDAGAVVPNINDDFIGKAPDLGAHEFGRPAAQYGPRR